MTTTTTTTTTAAAAPAPAYNGEYHVLNRRTVPVTDRFPRGLDYFSEAYATLADVLTVATTRATQWSEHSAVFCDAITWGRTTIANVDPAGHVTYTNDYANPARAHLAPADR